MTLNLDYEAHTMVCVDMAPPGMPVTTLGLKLVDAHVSDLEDCVGLVRHYWHRDGIRLKEAMKTWGQDFDGPIEAFPALLRLNRSEDRVPIVVTSADLAFGDRARRKRFRFLEAHGRGTGTFRVYCDGRYVAQQTVTATQTPDWARKMNLPRGTTGYCLRYEITGELEILGVVAGFDPLPGLQ